MSIRPELKINLLLWEANNRADRAIESAKKTIAAVDKRKINIPDMMYGRRKDDPSEPCPRERKISNRA